MIFDVHWMHAASPRRRRPQFFTLVSSAPFPILWARNARASTGGSPTIRRSWAAARTSRGCSGISRAASHRSKQAALPNRLVRRADRSALEHAILFDCISPAPPRRFDLFIDANSIRTNPSPPLLFRVERNLVSRGFERAMAKRFFAIFYQMRRAFYLHRTRARGADGPMRGLRQSLWNNVFTYDIRLYERCLVNRMKTSRLSCSAKRAPERAPRQRHRALAFIPYLPDKGCFAESFTRTFSRSTSRISGDSHRSRALRAQEGRFTAPSPPRGLLSQCSPHGAIFLGRDRRSLDSLGANQAPARARRPALFAGSVATNGAASRGASSRRRTDRSTRCARRARFPKTSTTGLLRRAARSSLRERLGRSRR